MRIVINGQQAFGKSVLDALLERGDDVIAVYCEPDREGGRPDPIKAAALEHGLPIFQPASFKKPEVWAEFEALKPDLCVMAYVTKIVPEEFLNIPSYGTIQYHPSLLPRHRGPSSINWPIIQGAAKTGLTIFWPDNGLDTGPVLLQKEVEIGADDTLGSIYFNQLFPLGVAAMVEGVDLVKVGKAPRIVQNEADATYESWCTADDVSVDWSQSSAKVHNLIRGADPQPGAWTTYKGKRLQIFDCARLEGVSGSTPGEVIAINGDGIAVAAGDGQILLKRVRGEGAKVAAAEFAAEAGLTPGQKFS
ncbi:MAG: methionyl-tRNA formyltransferase [Alphaproteobacteria bacterium]|jgi:methionyl-tRNA formyltransferase|nr:methionyl-tRNA formyltransferase [Alphaproteobacteria bacterium]MDP6255230.1 methionyl-tRNA formyltransferase [Alphaproteobacteria bacterium]MDP7053860.1 methionyl-tRNA formyltransferase [Alphaproteobacteria bacterium]MDP7227169.1 methionyl-tRNA formyltransferase [Alphaproteobacteria bacterium]MDP7461133.1 methionyl-tRNA formyltransferase [Alphaproteobacteria bacterium]|tara:strand:+ start:1586 stop:2500 length:915 start_codon:yes stop_codon:yes gene_type:complete